MFRESRKGFEKNQKFNGDKAYEGEELTKTPHKKPKKQELTSELIFVEHLIRFVKIFRVAKERFRLKLSKYEQIIMTICGLVRLRIGTFVLQT